MSQCWCESPSDRPSFCRLRHQLEELLCRDVTYLDLDNIDAPLAAHSQSQSNEDRCDDVDDDDDSVQRDDGGTSMSSTALLPPLHLDVC